MRIWARQTEIEEFKGYEHVSDFSKTCGLLKHESADCSGPPDMSEVLVLSNPGGVAGSGADARVGKAVANPNLNPSTLPKAGVGIEEGLASVLWESSLSGMDGGVASSLVNPFTTRFVHKRLSLLTLFSMTVWDSFSLAYVNYHMTHVW
ncbi:hypothetical protein ACLB2K_056102 [Fragaria x ananassa]